ncbi:MAG: hypothetical protein KH349_01925 [Clostridium sp.]|nr:hypothetical protein [Clostridium sp.]
MKKKISIVLLIVLVFSMMTMLVACNYETKYAKKLQKLGYTIIADSEEKYDTTCEGGFYTVTANNDNDDRVYILVFKKKDDATKAYYTLLSSKVNDRKSYQITWPSNFFDDAQVIQKGKKVFIGNKKAIKDLGL